MLGSIQSLFTGDIQAKSCIPSSFQPPDIGKNLGGVFLFSEFLVKFLINKNCHNSTTSNYIDMKVRPLTKYGKRNTKFQKNWRLRCINIVLLFFRFMEQLGAIQKPDSGYYFCQKMLNFCKKCWLQENYLCVCVLTYQISRS